VFRAGLFKYTRLGGLASGPRGMIAFADANGAIGSVSATGKIRETTVAGQGPADVAFDRAGNIWFVASISESIGKLSPSGRLTEHKLKQAYARTPNSIVFDRAGNLWVGMAGQICRIRPSGVVTSYRVPLEGLEEARASSLTLGSDGNVWFAATSGEDALAWGRITPSGQLTLFPTTAMPLTIGASKSGSLWIADAEGIGQLDTAGVITRIAPISAFAAGYPISFLAAASTHIAYFIDRGAIGSVDGDGHVVEQSVGVHDQPGDIAVASNGSVWFAESHGLARLTPRP
jgi:virginiamycin B lyase